MSSRTLCQCGIASFKGLISKQRHKKSKLGGGRLQPQHNQLLCTQCPAEPSVTGTESLKELILKHRGTTNPSKAMVGNLQENGRGTQRNTRQIAGIDLFYTELIYIVSQLDHVMDRRLYCASGACQTELLYVVIFCPYIFFTCSSKHLRPSTGPCICIQKAGSIAKFPFVVELMHKQKCKKKTLVTTCTKS